MTKTFTTKKLVLCALFAALTAVCSQIMIPLPMVPINLALFAVFLAGGLLGATGGAISQIVFTLIGLVGVPVFAGFRGGPGVILGPTGGYIWGYIAAAWITGWLVKKLGDGFWRSAAAMLAGLVVCYTFGTIWFLFLTGKGLIASLTICVLPFLPGDAVKITLASLLVKRLRKEKVFLA